MGTAVTRRQHRRDFPGPLPIEQALLARADALDEQAQALMTDLGTPTQELGAGIRQILAAEFRALAEELHWW